MWTKFGKALLNLDKVSYFYPFDSSGGAPRIEVFAEGNFDLTERFNTDQEMFIRFNELENLLLQSRGESVDANELKNESEFYTVKDLMETGKMRSGDCIIIHGRISSYDKYDETDSLAVECGLYSEKSAWLPADALIAKVDESLVLAVPKS